MHRYDVIVIGASVAGSTACAILSRAGLKVALIDKATFPRRKPCGEGLSAKGIEVLKRNELWPSSATLPTNPYTGMRLTVDGRYRCIEPVFGPGISLQRTVLDNYLAMRAALGSTTDFFEGVHIHRVDCEGLVTLNSDTIRARYIVVADGGRSKTAQMLAARSVRTGPPRSGLTATFVGSFRNTPDQIQIFIERPHEVYCTPLPNSRLNVSILAPFPAQSNLSAQLLNSDRLRTIFESNGFSGELELSPLGRAPIGNIRREHPHTSIFLIGDALEEFDPIGGMGMTHALASAELAAKAIMRVERGELPLRAAKAWFIRERERAAKPLRLFTNMAYKTLRSSVRAPMIIDLLSSRVGTLLSRTLFSKELSI